MVVPRGRTAPCPDGTDRPVHVPAPGSSPPFVTLGEVSTGPHDERAASAQRRGLPLWSIAALAVIGGLAIGWFATAGNDDSPSTSGGGTALPSTGAPEDAIAALEAAVEARPEDATAWRQLGTAYVQQAIEIGDPSFYGLAERSFEEATALAPDDPTILVGRGVLALSLHEFAEAEELGRRAVAALPANADALGVLVDAQIELGEYDEAAETLQRMLDVRPGLPALARTSYLRQLRGELGPATEAMRQAVVAGASSPFDEATVTALLGDLQRFAGNQSGALESYERALELFPGLIHAELGRALVIGGRGELAAAAAAVEEVVERFPSPSALFVLADLQHALGDVEGEADTLELVRLTAALQEEAGQIVDLELALFEADIGDDPARAIALAEEALAARPDNVFAADAMAWALLRGGQAAAAVPFAEDAVRLGTADPLLQYRAAEVFAAAGEDERAAEHLGLALQAGPMLSIRHADDVAALAEELGVPLPATES